MTHLLMVLLQVSQLLFQALNLHLQVGPGQGQLIQHPAQAVDVSLHAQTQGLFRLKPFQGNSCSQASAGSVPLAISPWFRSLWGSASSQLRWRRAESRPPRHQALSRPAVGPISLTWLLQLPQSRDTYLVRKSSAARRALSICRTILELSMVASRIWKGGGWQLAPVWQTSITSPLSSQRWGEE